MQAFRDVFTHKTKCLYRCNADASKHVGLLMIYKILLINISCAFVSLDNKKFVQIFLKLFVIVVVQHYISCF